MPDTFRIPFADRIDTIHQIIEIIQSSCETKDYNKCQKEAQQLELEIYNNATSEQDYDSQLEAKLQALVDPSRNTETAKESEKGRPPTLDHSSQPTKQIGVHQAVYHASGAFSTVYKALEKGNGTVLDRLIALKVTKPSQAQAPHDPRREARILAAARHASVVPVLSTFSISDGHFVLSFPFARLDLASLLDAPQKIRRNAIFKSQTRNHLQSLFSALAHIHSLGIIHRDIKPSNILLEGPGGPAYLADFGIAYMLADPASEPTDEKVTDVGTTCYRPPELLFGNKAYGTSLDLWAAGCVVAETVGKGELFDAGDLGSEFALIKSQFSTLGTPTVETWPEANNFSDWGKFEFKEYPAKPWTDILPAVSVTARDLVGKLVQYQSTWRLSASDALKHPFFQEESVD